MPRYDFECSKCQSVVERLLPLSHSDAPQYCDRCNELMQKVFLQAPAGVVQPNYPAYRCPITDKVIDGRKAHEENLARHGCRVLEAGEKEAAERHRLEADAALDRGIEETVEREIALMPADKKERLANELAAGADATVERH